MNGGAVLQGAVSGVFSATVLVALIAFFRDRRSLKAKGDIAEQTVDIQVDVDRLALLESRLALLNQTFNAERATLNATIAHLQAEVAGQDRKIERLQKELDGELLAAAKKDRRIADLEKQVNGIQAEIEGD